jgi:hypothetical protein
MDIKEIFNKIKKSEPLTETEKEILKNYVREKVNEFKQRFLKNKGDNK